MPKYRLTKIYTRTGDDGTTGLGFGQRVPKDDLRVEAYGTIDELNSCIGLAIALNLQPDLEAICKTIQHNLLHVGADLCVLEQDQKPGQTTRMELRHVVALEGFIDQLQKSLKPLENFILPGGCPGAAQLHVCRCVCRRAERAIVKLRKTETIGAQVVPYVNRLSDLLFVMARYENLKKGVPDTLWQQAE
ncbi:MAG TPA: cob(I)yrinic acid a,c-diamide adenosyltransferase [Planctomycetota bacterium]